MDRPLGVSILSVYSWIVGVLIIVEGVVLVVVSPATPYLAAPLSAVVLLGAFSLVLGFGQIAFGYGAWGLRPWAWPLGLTLFLASIPLDVSALGTSTVVSTVGSGLLAVFIVYYLCQRHIRDAFGRGEAAGPGEPAQTEARNWPDGRPPWIDHH